MLGPENYRRAAMLRFGKERREMRVLESWPDWKIDLEEDSTFELAEGLETQSARA